jgi:Kef-type K+ transport system membrane component KefB
MCGVLWVMFIRFAFSLGLVRQYMKDRSFPVFAQSGKPQRILFLTVSFFIAPMVSFYLVFISLVVALGGFVYGVDSGE